MVASGVTTPFESEAVGWARMSLPRLLVRQIMVFYGEQPESIVTGRNKEAYLEINLATLAVRNTALVKDL